MSILLSDKAVDRIRKAVGFYERLPADLVGDANPVGTRRDGFRAAITGDQSAATSGPAGYSWKKVQSDGAGSTEDDLSPTPATGTGTAFEVNDVRQIQIGAVVWLRFAGYVADGSGTKVPIFLFDHELARFLASITGIESGGTQHDFEQVDFTGAPVTGGITGTTATEVNGRKGVVTGTRVWITPYTDATGAIAYSFDLADAAFDDPKDLRQDTYDGDVTPDTEEWHDDAQYPYKGMEIKLLTRLGITSTTKSSSLEVLDRTFTIDANGHLRIASAEELGTVTIPAGTDTGTGGPGGGYIYICGDVTPTDGMVLVYNAASACWEPTATTTQAVVTDVSYDTTSHVLKQTKATVTILAVTSGTDSTVDTAVSCS